MGEFRTVALEAVVGELQKVAEEERQNSVAVAAAVAEQRPVAGSTGSMQHSSDSRHRRHTGRHHHNIEHIEQHNQLGSPLLVLKLLRAEHWSKGSS